MIACNLRRGENKINPCVENDVKAKNFDYQRKI